MYSDYPSIVFYILLLLMLSSGIIYIAKQSPQRFVIQLLIWVIIFLGIFGLVAFFLINKVETKKKYYPPKFDGEVVIPGYFDEN